MNQVYEVDINLIEEFPSSTQKETLFNGRRVAIESNETVLL